MKKKKDGEIMLLVYLTLIDEEQQKEKFELLYEKYRKPMFYAANRILNDTYLAEDAVHQAFINIIKYLDRIDDVGCHKTRTLIVIIVENISISLYRQRKRYNTVDYDDYEFNLYSDEETEAVVFEKLGTDIILKNIRELPESDSRILSLRYIVELSDKEIAALLGLTHSAVRKRLERARKKLAERIGRT